MKPKTVTTTYTLALLMVSIAVVGVTQSVGQGALPPSSNPTSGAAFNRNHFHEFAPVTITDFSIEDAGYEFRVTNVVLNNLFAKPIKAVELTWYLVERENNAYTIVKEGLPTTWLALPELLKKNEKLKLDHAVVIRKVLLNEAEIAGDRQVQIAVTNVLYADGSSFKPRWRVRKV